jgi:hypothetical protein
MRLIVLVLTFGVLGLSCSPATAPTDGTNERQWHGTIRPSSGGVLQDNRLGDWPGNISFEIHRAGVTTLTLELGCVVSPCTYCAAAAWVSPSSTPTCGDVYSNSCPLAVWAPEWPHSPGPQTHSASLPIGKYDLSAKAILNPDPAYDVIPSSRDKECPWTIRLSFPP